MIFSSYSLESILNTPTKDSPCFHCKEPKSKSKPQFIKPKGNLFNNGIPCKLVFTAAHENTTPMLKKTAALKPLLTLISKIVKKTGPIVKDKIIPKKIAGKKSVIVFDFCYVSAKRYCLVECFWTAININCSAKRSFSFKNISSVCFT